MAAMAQDGWKATWNGKEVLRTTAEDTGQNKIIITPADLRKNKNFTLTYQEEENKKGWERTITAFGPDDTQLVKQKGNTLTIKNPELRSLFKKAKTISIYTWALPTDPKLKARIRVRRVHLCTLVLQ
jgi:hypothetical protein